MKTIFLLFIYTSAYLITDLNDEYDGKFEIYLHVHYFYLTDMIGRALSVVDNVSGNPPGSAYIKIRNSKSVFFPKF